MTKISARLVTSRKKFYSELNQAVHLADPKGVPTTADSANPRSVRIAKKIADQIGIGKCDKKPSGQTLGSKFEVSVFNFVKETFQFFEHLRPGHWIFSHAGSQDNLKISACDQYSHLAEVQKIILKNPELRVFFGEDYVIKPDIVIARKPESDKHINQNIFVVNDSVCALSTFRESNSKDPILHANISCKWTIRSDRAQNARSEALNLLRNRKGRAPHIVVVTAEPLPSRLASLALGTGDIDCVYHIALPALQKSVADLKLADAKDLLETMISGKRLRDITDLPLDLST